MTDPKPAPNDDEMILQKKGSGTAQPDQPAQKPEGPASGGEGAAGSGGSKGFGAGT